MAPAKEAEKRFLETLSTNLVSLPFDLKVLYEAMVDPNLERKAMEIAAGAVIYILSPNDLISDKNNAIGFSDDVILLRLTLKRILELGGADAATAFRERFSEIYEKLDEELGVYSGFLGGLFTWMATKIDALPKQVYKGKSIAEYLDDEEASSFLYEEGLAFTTDYRVTEKSLEGRLKKTDTIVDLLSRRRAEEAKRIG